MKKIPCLFKREFENHKVTKLLNEVTEGCEWVYTLPTVIATEKFDGTACLIKEGKLYKRYDAKKGKKVPEEAILCQPEADPITGHFPVWVPVKEDKPDDKWYIKAFKQLERDSMIYDKYIIDGTYELCGPHFQTNPYNLNEDTFFKHGSKVIEELEDYSFESIKNYLETHNIEGIVFWSNKQGEQMCKIRRKDFGFPWNEKREK